MMAPIHPKQLKPPYFRMNIWDMIQSFVKLAVAYFEGFA